jgi:hypothetical protein
MSNRSRRSSEKRAADEALSYAEGSKSLSASASHARGRRKGSPYGSAGASDFPHEDPSGPETLEEPSILSRAIRLIAEAARVHSPWRGRRWPHEDDCPARVDGSARSYGPSHRDGPSCPRRDPRWSSHGGSNRCEATITVSQSKTYSSRDAGAAAADGRIASWNF